MEWMDAARGSLFFAECSIEGAPMYEYAIAVCDDDCSNRSYTMPRKSHVVALSAALIVPGNVPGIWVSRAARKSRWRSSYLPLGLLSSHCRTPAFGCFFSRRCTSDVNMPARKDVSVPEIDGRESFDALVRKLSVYVHHVFKTSRGVVSKLSIGW